MAGRKSTPEPTFLSMLLGRLGLGSQPTPPKKRRRRAQRAPENVGRAGAGFTNEDDVSPFADFGAQGGLMGPENPDPQDPSLSYAEAQAAGFAPPEPLPPPPPLEIPAAPAAVGGPTGGRLFQEDALDTSLDALFSGLESGIGAPPMPPPAPEAKPAREDFDEFGLSDPSPAKGPGPARILHTPIVTPVAPTAVQPPVPVPARPTLPKQTPNAFTPVPQAPTQENVLVLAHGVNLQHLMGALAQVPGAEGALLVGYDGLLIASELPPSLDADFLGAQAGTLFSASDAQMAKIQRGPLRRIFLETDRGAMLVTAADMGILVLVSRSKEVLDIAAAISVLQRVLDTGAAE